MNLDPSKIELLKRRDLINFVRLRNSHPGEDLEVGDLLVQSFKETYARKLPEVVTNADRERELRDVASRRSAGVVRIAVLGFQIIGTYSLILPGDKLDESWNANTATLRCVAIAPAFQSLKLGELILDDVVRVARGWRVSSICLHVQQGATGVARMYEAFGFMRDHRGDKVWMANLIEGYRLHLTEKDIKSQLA